MKVSMRKTARAVVVHEGKVLLMERWRKDENGRVMHYFSIPGGGVERGESLEAAAVRELYEEMHILVRPQRLIGTTPRHNGGTHTYFLCGYLAGEAALRPDSPEAKHQSASNRHIPCWITKTQFSRIALHPEYEPMRPAIAALL